MKALCKVRCYHDHRQVMHSHENKENDNEVWMVQVNQLLFLQVSLRFSEDDVIYFYLLGERTT